ncbi:MAG TPA: hypothetical protein PK817_13380, partial [Dokdonella sp.]|nr:hypothetical protein [Dokdonella sp.]
MGRASHQLRQCAGIGWAAVNPWILNHGDAESRLLYSVAEPIHVDRVECRGGCALRAYPPYN